MTSYSKIYKCIRQTSNIVNKKEESVATSISKHNRKIYEAYSLYRRGRGDKYFDQRLKIYRQLVSPIERYVNHENFKRFVDYLEYINTIERVACIDSITHMNEIESKQYLASTFFNPSLDFLNKYGDRLNYRILPLLSNIVLLDFPEVFEIEAQIEDFKVYYFYLETNEGDLQFTVITGEPTIVITQDLKVKFVSDSVPYILTRISDLSSTVEERTKWFNALGISPLNYDNIKIHFRREKLKYPMMDNILDIIKDEDFYREALVYRERYYDMLN